MAENPASAAVTTPTASPDALQERLHEAARRGDVVGLLDALQAGADPNFKNKEYGWTALHHTAREGRVPVSKILLDYGADVNIPDATGQTPLHRAVFHNHRQLVSLFLASNADPTLKDTFSQTSLEIASIRSPDDKNMIAMLQQAAMRVEKRKNEKKKADEMRSGKLVRRISWLGPLTAPDKVSRMPNSPSAPAFLEARWTSSIDPIPEDDVIHIASKSMLTIPTIPEDELASDSLSILSTSTDASSVYSPPQEPDDGTKPDTPIPEQRAPRGGITLPVNWMRRRRRSETN